jgi:hypothetical protein
MTAPELVLLTGRPGCDGFCYHDGNNQPVHQGAPGILGLLESRPVLERWKPSIITWLDGTDHFFNHILHEFDGEPSFEPARRQIAAIRRLDAPAATRSRFLFQYLTELAGGIERRELTRLASRGVPPPPEAIRLRPRRPPATYSLNGLWTAHYRTAPGEYGTRHVELPANWELFPGIENYAGSMRFTKLVDLPAKLQGKRLVVAFQGADYFADLWINGHYVGGHEGFFGPFEFDLSPFLVSGGLNLLRLTVTSPNDPSGDGVHVTSGWNDFRPASAFPNRKSLVKGTLGHHDAKRGGAWNSMTSQDGNTGGVWNDVALRVHHDLRFEPLATRITTQALAPISMIDCCSATVQLRFCVHNAGSETRQAKVRVAVAPSNFEGRTHRFTVAVTAQPGPNEVSVERVLAPISPWEPWDRGFPHLYSVTAALQAQGAVQDRTAVQTGFRVLSVTPLGESPGPNGAFLVNGERVFVRGTNLLPTYWLSEYDPERIERDFQMLRAAGFNAILVHNLVGPRRLYEHADRSGFMVVQMFPLQWSYEQSPHFVGRAAAQIREMAELLCNHPSVVSYEVHNEPDMRTTQGLDNRLFDFDLHTLLRQADPYRWATTFSGGNHAYPGQFYPLRDDNSFATLPGTFQEHHFHGWRISRHRNMPTEFGIQAMPNVELFRELVSEDAVRRVLRRMRTDPKWLAAGGETWADTEAAVQSIKNELGGGSWERALEELDWSHLWRMDQLAEEVRQLAAEPTSDNGRELLLRRLALLLLDVLHYGGFKGENFWFGLWRPAHSLEDFVASSQDRQYRLHKDAIETLLNAGVTGPIVGYFSFMFRDCDRLAPTWGVVDAASVPKKAYRAYVESNQPVRVTLPQALRRPVRLPGDSWFALAAAGRDRNRPWTDADMIVANDTATALSGACVSVWLEDPAGERIGFVDGAGQTREVYQVTVDLEPGAGLEPSGRLAERRRGDAPVTWVVPEDVVSGSYFLRAQVATAAGEVLSTNSYELVVPDVTFAWLADLARSDVVDLLEGGARSPGFHFWDHGRVVHRANSGVAGLVAGVQQAEARRIDLSETVQGEHFFRHILSELATLETGRFLSEPIWRIRSEVLSPSEKSDVLLRYLELFIARAEAHLGIPERDRHRRIGGG